MESGQSSSDNAFLGQEPKVILNFGNGTCDTGFTSVTAQIWQGDSPAPSQVVGALPGAAQLAKDFQHWQKLYRLLPGNLPRWWGYRSSNGFEVDEDDITNVSSSEFRRLSDHLEQQLNAWLDADSFRPIDRQLRTLISPKSPLRIMLVAQDQQLLRLPWCRWTLLEDYPKAEIALSPTNYGRSIKTELPKEQGIKILGVLGNGEGIDLETDRQLIEALPEVKAKFLRQPSWQELSESLWSEHWDILFFAGHSSSDETGYIQLSPTEKLSVAQLKNGLKKAIEAGLQLAILNSCDGLGLAWELADLKIPQVIAMGEPVADPVAQEFLKYFLKAFSSHQTLYQSVRDAREKLQPKEAVHCCASWLPVIVQNPAEQPPTWRSLSQGSIAAIETQAVTQTPAQTVTQAAAPDLTTADTATIATAPPTTVPSPATPTPTAPERSSWRSRLSKLRVPLLSTLGATAVVLGLGVSGRLMPLELWAFDQLMRLRPSEGPDPRLLVITIDETDIQNQALAEREVSLSDQSLNRLLVFLRESGANMVGIDLYRDFPVSEQALPLIEEFKYPNVIGICKGRDPTVDKTGIAPPPKLDPRQVGFSDFVTDSDGVLRRQIISMTPDVTAACRANYSFSSQIVFRYLAQQKIEISRDENDHLQLGNQTFIPLQPNSGGYESIDAQGSQIMINYRALQDPESIAAQASLQQVLEGKLSPEAVRDRIVLIGVVAPSNGDFWATPYGSSTPEEVSGVFIHAHLISQMLGAVLDDRPLIGSWPQRGEGIWLLAWASLGSICVMRVGGSLKALILWGGSCMVLLTGLSWMLLLQGGWVPLVPAAMGFSIAAIATLAFLQPGSLPSSLPDSVKK